MVPRADLIFLRKDRFPEVRPHTVMLPKTKLPVQSLDSSERFRANLPG